jgi:hypothetical protein
MAVTAYPCVTDWASSSDPLTLMDVSSLATTVTD